jgi:hypothetical protein
LNQYEAVGLAWKYAMRHGVIFGCTNTAHTRCVTATATGATGERRVSAVPAMMISSSDGDRIVDAEWIHIRV